MATDVNTKSSTLPEIKKVVDAIRAYCTSADQTNTPEMAGLAMEYAGIRLKLNERLERCRDLLENGHRPEAILLAEAEPNLLKLVGLVEFPELDVWQESAASYAWTRSAPLKMDVAKAINDAYSIESELKDLLRSHRRMALELRPVRERLAVLRQIAAKDVTTAYWRADVALLERERLRELNEHADMLLRTPSAESMRDFIKQYDQETWSTPPAAELQAGFARIFTRFHENYTLPLVASEVAAAYSVEDVEKLFRLRRTWMAICGRAAELLPNWKPPARLMAMVTPGFNLVRESEEQQRADAFHFDVQQLLNAILTEEPLEQIGVLEAAVESHGYAMPANVAAQLAAYRQIANVNKKLSIWVIVALFTGGVVIIAFGYLILRLAAKG